jgi:acyl-CoA synthetase (AMP-forming)/AMP-acid ligase II
LSANGRPQAGNDFRIVDPATDEAVADGQTGEIQLRGRTLSPGYFNRPEANAAAYTRDGWLRSGDMGAVIAGGALHYIARLKEIIRVGGENFAPAEVEQVMRDYCGIQQVCVLGVPHPRLDEVAAAVVVGAPEVDWKSVIDTLSHRLAGFKIPKEIYVAESLPMTVTNRVQRAVLNEWIAGRKLVRVV